MLNFWHSIVLIALAGTLPLLGVLLGAMIVYRTKREPHETLFGPTPKGEVFSIEDHIEEEQPGPDPERERLLNRINGRNDEFVAQFADKIINEGPDDGTV